MTRAQRILQIIEQDQHEPTFDRKAGAVRSDLRVKVRKDNLKRAKRKRKAKNQYKAGMIDRKTFKARHKRIRSTAKHDKQRLKNKTFKPGHQGSLNIYDLRGNKNR